MSVLDFLLWCAAHSLMAITGSEMLMNRCAMRTFNEQAAFALHPSVLAISQAPPPSLPPAAQSIGMACPPGRALFRR